MKKMRIMINVQCLLTYKNLVCSEETHMYTVVLGK